MSHRHTMSEPRTVSPSAVPQRATPVRRPAPAPLPVPPAAPQRPSRLHQLLPAGVRNLLADWGWWQNPIPLKPSDHLMQVVTVLEQYGWCKSLDFSPTGRMCIRGAQKFLLHSGHVTPAACKQAVVYMQQTLQEHGIHEPFFAWNDHMERQFPQVKALLVHAAHAARKNGE